MSNLSGSGTTDSGSMVSGSARAFSAETESRVASIDNTLRMSGRGPLTRRDERIYRNSARASHETTARGQQKRPPKPAAFAMAFEPSWSDVSASFAGGLPDDLQRRVEPGELAFRSVALLALLGPCGGEPGFRGRAVLPEVDAAKT